MGNIDNLNFKIILNDQDFNKQIAKDLQLAKDLNTEVSKLLDFQSQMASAAKGVADATREVQDATEEASRATRQHKKDVEDLNSETRNQSTLLRSLRGAAAAYFSIDGARRFVTELTRITGEFEKQQVSLRAILQDVAGADALFDKVKRLAVVSPFSVLDLTTYAKQLSAFSVPLDEIYDTTKMLADVSAGLGVDMGRIILAYGQIRSASFLRGQEVRQLTEAGIPILAELAKQFEELEGRAVSVSEVFDKISARQVPFEMVEKAFKDMTGEGGKFYEMQEVLADTLTGKISNLRDSYEIMMSSIGNANSGVLKGAVNMLTKMMNNYEKIGRDLVSLAAAYGVYKTAVYLTTWAQKGFVAANYAIIKSLEKVKAALLKNPYAWLAAALVLVGRLIYRIVTAETELEKAQKAVNGTIEKFHADVSSEISNLDYLYGRLKNAAVGTAEYEEARKSLLNTYGQYLSDVDKEALAVGNLTGLYVKLADAIRATSRENALSEGMTEIAKSQAEKMQSVYSIFNKAFAGNIDKGIKAQLQDYIKGKIKASDMSSEAQAFYSSKTTNSLTPNRANIFEDLRNSISDINKETAEMRNNLVDSLEFVYGVTADKSPEVLQDYEKRVKAVLDKYTDVAGLQPLSTKGKGYWDYIDDLRKLYADNVNKLKDAGGLEEGNNVVATLKAQNEVISEIFSEAFGGKVSLVDIKTREKEDKEEADAAQKAIENKIRLVKEMAAQYAKMKDAGIGDKSIRDKFDSVYDESDRGLYSTFDFERTLEALEAQLVKAGSSAAEQAKAMFRTKEIDSFTNAFRESAKALEEWLGFYDEINESSPESSTDSFGARVQRILNKLNAANYKDSQSAGKALTNLAEGESAYVEKMGREAWDKYADAGLEAIDRWTEAAKQANVDVAQQSLYSLGKSYLDTFFTSQGINMNDLNDKSFGQLQTMLDKLKEVNPESLIPEDVVQRAKRLGVNVEPVIEFIKQSIHAKEQDILGAMFGDVSAMANAALSNLNDVESTMRRIAELRRVIEYKKAKGEDVTSEEKGLQNQTDLLKAQLKSPYVWMDGIARAAKEAANHMREFAEATGDTKLADMADEMSSIAQTLGAAAEGGASGGWIGAIISGVGDMINQTIAGIVQAKAYAAQLKQTMTEYRRQLELNRLAVNDGDYSSPFGTKSISKTMEAFKKGKAAISEYSKYVTEKMAEPEKKMKRRSIGLAVFAPGIFSQKALSGEETQKSKAAMQAYLNGYNKLQGMMVKTKSKNGWQKFWGAQDKYTALKDLAPNIWDEDGTFNVENATAFLNTSKQLTEEQKKQLQYAVDLKNAYDEAIKAIDDQLEDMFGDMATDLTDIIFDSVMNGSDAWDQFREKGSEAILELGKQLMQEMMISEYLEPYKEQLRNAYKEGSIKDTQEQLREITKNMYGGLMDLIPMLQESADSWIEWMKNEGFDPTSSSNSLTDGIKSITESTANLIASYLNAMRSDLSQIRAMQAGMNSAMAAMLESLPKAPSLMDYLTKIEAHTANIAADTSSILKQLKSVITTQGGGAALAVYM
nr:MAG TPA: tail tape measure protein [Caudoviricetes sp.]